MNLHPINWLRQKMGADPPPFDQPEWVRDATDPTPRPGSVIDLDGALANIEQIDARIMGFSDTYANLRTGRGIETETPPAVAEGVRSERITTMKAINQEALSNTCNDTHT
jgi:hypothetical protein